ncbi:MAG TPA: hypothetical protein VH186_23990 [Chloroflexia bacterium]|nr:hypothetical protein [Chloroflexia bacterium]
MMKNFFLRKKKRARKQLYQNLLTVALLLGRRWLLPFVLTRFTGKRRWMLLIELGRILYRQYGRKMLKRSI